VANNSTFFTFAAFGFFILWVIAQLWYIFIPLIIIIISVYFLMKYYDNKAIEEKRIRDEKHRRLLEQQRLENQRKQKELQEKERLEQERQEKLRKEKRKQELFEQEKLRKEKRKQELFEQEQNRIKSRLEQFSLSESEAEILFGKTWKKRMAKPEKEFAYEEISRICVKLEEDCAKILVKIYDFADKVFDMIDYYIQWSGKRIGWDDIDFENWKEDWDDIRETWGRTKYQYRPKDSKKQRKKKESSTHFDYCCDVLGIPRDCSKKEIKTRYRKMMLKFHPDRNDSKDAEEKCKKINEAYEVLIHSVNHK